FKYRQHLGSFLTDERDATGQAFSYVYYENEPGRRSAAKLFTKDEARRIVVNIAKLPRVVAEAEINRWYQAVSTHLDGTLRKYWRRTAFQDAIANGSERIARQAYRRAVLRYPPLNAQCDQ